MMFDAKRELVSLVEKATSRGEVVLSSGRRSDFYVDARVVTLSARGAWLTATLMLDMMKETEFDLAGGPALGADPILGALAALSWQNGWPLDTFIVRSSPKKYGKKRAIEGPIREGAAVVLVDDVLTTGGSILSAAETVEEFGCPVARILVLVDREEGARESLEKKGYQVDSVVTRTDLKTQ